MIRDIEKGLVEAALGYLEIGLEKFHKVRSISYYNFQPALGNLSISIELMLKSIIAKKSIQFLFSNLPLELEVKLTSEDVRKKNKIKKVDELSMKYFKFKSIELNRAISIFYTYFPELKHELKPYFNLFASIRNISVHGAFPMFQKYDLERIAYLALRILETLKEEKISGFNFHKLTKKDEDFFSRYDSNRVERVKKAIENAKNKAEKIDYWSSFDLNEWEFYVTSCPVCGCDGTLTGSTEYDCEYNVEEVTCWLYFYADSFECEECGLQLLDSTELELANMETSYDRDSDLGKWLYEKEGI